MKPTIHQIIIDNIGSMDIDDETYDLFMNHAAQRIRDAFPLDTTDPSLVEVVAKFNEVYTAFIRSNCDPLFTLDNMTDDERNLREALADVFAFPPIGETGYRTDVILDAPGLASVFTSSGTVFVIEYTERQNPYTVDVTSVIDVHDDPIAFEGE